MRNKGLLVALIIFIGAFSLYYFGDLKASPTPTPGATPSAAPIMGAKASQMTAVRIKARGKTLTVSRTGASTWTYSVCPDTQATCAPDPADPSRAAALFQAIAELRPAGPTIFGAPAGLDAYGLGSSTSGEIQVSAGGVRSLVLGGKTPDGSYTYGRRTTANDVFTFSSAVLESQILNAIDSPPRPVPTPVPSTTASAPSVTPSPPPAGPVLPSSSPSP